MPSSSQLIMLGTGNAMCTRCYNTCFYLRTPGGGLMVDAGGGNGIFRQLYKAHVTVEEVRNLFVTHVHTDHILGVVWMVRKISPMIHKGRHTAPFTIYCNAEVADAVRTICRLTMPRKICSALDDTIILREVTDGETLTIDDITCLGDEPYNPVAEQYAREADWLLCEAFCLYGDRAQFNPYEKNHSTALDAGQTAQQLGVKNLLLYHTEDTHLATRHQAYATEAASHFTGRIVVPDDLETIDL